MQLITVLLEGYCDALQMILSSELGLTRKIRSNNIVFTLQRKSVNIYRAYVVPRIFYKLRKININIDRSIIKIHIF